MNTILLINSQPQQLGNMMAMLKNVICNCDVVTAQSGLSGIEEAKRVLPDTILIDGQVVEMNSLDLCEILKSDRITQHIPIIFISMPNISASRYHRAIQAGADVLISKPVNEAVLKAQINIILMNKRNFPIQIEEKCLDRVPIIGHHT